MKIPLSVKVLPNTLLLHVFNEDVPDNYKLKIISFTGQKDTVDILKITKSWGYTSYIEITTPSYMEHTTPLNEAHQVSIL